jgi:hypothetical protein
MKKQRMYRDCKYTFTVSEIRELGRDMAKEAAGLYDTRSLKATTTAEFASRIKASEKRIADLAERINSGFELRPVEVIAIMDSPRAGRKSIVRTDNQETVEEEPMTEAEQQASFSFAQDPKLQ